MSLCDEAFCETKEDLLYAFLMIFFTGKFDMVNFENRVKYSAIIISMLNKPRYVNPKYNNEEFVDKQ